MIRRKGGSIGRALVVFSLMAGAALAAPGCMKREAYNLFPGTPGYDKRIATFTLQPDQAYLRAKRRAEQDGRTEYVSLQPTVVHGRKYVFSMPVADGANLHGYHVDGDNNQVLFYTKDEIVKRK